MKCHDCQQAELQSATGDLTYVYKGKTTVIRGVRMLRCLLCGAEFVAPGYIDQLSAQLTAFYASVDAGSSAAGVLLDCAELKDTIIDEWLDFDPDQLAADVPVVTFQRERRHRDGTIETVDVPYVSWEALGTYNERVCQAFGWYKGGHATDVPGHVYVSDWRDFLADLRKARAIAAEPGWTPAGNGVVYPQNKRSKGVISPT